MALEGFFDAHDVADLRTLADALASDDLDSQFRSELRERIDDWPLTRLEDALLAQDDPIGAVGTFNEILDRLDLERIPAPEPTVEAPDGLEIEEVDEAALEAVGEIRRFATNLSDARLRQLIDALEADDPGAAPGEATAHMRRLDDQAREDLVDEMREVLQEREAEAERTGERTRMDRFPGIQEATDRGPGRGVSYFRGVLQELRGERDADRLPADELERARREEAVLEQFITKAERNLGALEGPSDPAEAVTGSLGVSIDELLGGAVSQSARRVVPKQARHDWLVDEDWRATEQQRSLELRFMSWVVDIHGHPHRFDQSYFQLKPENRGRQIHMDAYARLQVQAGNSSVQQAVEAGLPAEWFDDGRDGGGAATV